jgi:hypothetical protein
MQQLSLFWAISLRRDLVPDHAASRNEGRARSSAHCPYGLMSPWNSGVNARSYKLEGCEQARGKTIPRPELDDCILACVNFRFLSSPHIASAPQALHAGVGRHGTTSPPCRLSRGNARAHPWCARERLRVWVIGSNGTGEQTWATGRGAGGAKEEDRGEHRRATHVPDSEPGKRAATAITTAFARCSKYARPLRQPCSVSCINSWQSQSTRRLITKREGGTQ